MSRGGQRKKVHWLPCVISDSKRVWRCGGEQSGGSYESFWDNRRVDGGLFRDMCGSRMGSCDLELVTDQSPISWEALFRSDPWHFHGAMDLNPISL